MSDRELLSEEYLGGRELLNYITIGTCDAGLLSRREQKIGAAGSASHAADDLFSLNAVTGSAARVCVGVGREAHA
ncbi:hypothetical protein BBta_4335 [Bradyrhizobium sp. BTAi1]|nr:hypothetical protein BBta_4335 [Bradyrhizobium sp. BTAi1]